ncbi:IS110 family transposase [Streptomyces cyaneus]|uniref:IS110 family transposase n=1 Tax=Streptomyces cyaneus TaxID=1904 RepID=UPI001FECF244|nr:IS110 family transposase [Streptomyces cyaneus]
MPTAHFCPIEHLVRKRVITIGIDPHKSSHTAVAIDAAGHKIGQRKFVVNAGTFGQLVRWCEPWSERRFAVEGAGGLGRTLAQQLAAAGEDVVDVPSTLSARARLLATGGDRKTDPADALHVAQVALFRADLRKVTSEGQSTILRLLTERHDDLVNERTRLTNRLHALLRDLLPGGAPTRLSADKAAALMKGIRPITATDNCRRDLARDLLADLRRLDRQVRDNEAQMREALAASRTTLTALPGLGTVLAARVLGHIGDISRFPTEHHFASYTGSAPLDASSGRHVRHRLNTGGNRALNSALHIIAVCQIRDGGRGQEYYLRKIAEGKTPAEARRALKRRLSNVVYRIMKRDQRHQLAAVA